jgi:hypothetical protein
MTQKSRLLAAGAVLFLTVAASPAFACGESLFRVGKGMAYREYTAPLPGTIVVVAQSEEDLEFLKLLSAAGHDITVVPTADQLSEQLANRSFDIVMAPFGDREIVARELAGNPATYLPVAEYGSEEVKMARKLFPESLDNHDSLKQFLRVIHKTLKHRQA